MEINHLGIVFTIFTQASAAAENEDNVAEQRRQLGKKVRYGEVIQVSVQ